MLRTAALVLAALTLTGCTQGYVYLRADGRDLSEDPALYQQFETDRMTCQGERHSVDIPTNAAYHSGDIGAAGRDCMAQKGYMVVQADVADVKRQDLAAKAAEKAQREAAAAAPPPPPAPPPAPPKRVAAKPKPKPKSQPAQVRSTPAPNWPAPQAPPS